MNLTIHNADTTIWDNYQDGILPSLLVYGGEIYAETGDLTNKAKWIYSIKKADGTFEDNPPFGYETLRYYEPNCGIWDTQNTYRQPSGDVGLYTLSKAYPSLDFQYGVDENDPLDFTFDDLLGIDIVGDGIPETDFIIMFDAIKQCFTNWAAQPYEQHMDVNGNPLYTSDGKERWVIKSF